MTQSQQKHSDDLFIITRDELDRCCNQMSISGYKVSANYVEAMVLSRPHTSTPATQNCDKCECRFGCKKWMRINPTKYDTAIRNVLKEELMKFVESQNEPKVKK